MDWSMLTNPRFYLCTVTIHPTWLPDCCLYPHGQVFFSRSCDIVDFNKKFSVITFYWSNYPQFFFKSLSHLVLKQLFAFLLCSQHTSNVNKMKPTAEVGNEPLPWASYEDKAARLDSSSGFMCPSLSEGVALPH